MIIMRRVIIGIDDPDRRVIVSLCWYFFIIKPFKKKAQCQITLTGTVIIDYIINCAVQDILGTAAGSIMGHNMYF